MAYSQQAINIFWSHIGFEQNTRRLIIHDNMRNLIYMDGWQVLNRNGATFLYDSTTQRLFDRQLNYYFQGKYYDRKGNVLKDLMEDSVVNAVSPKPSASNVKEVIKTDPIYGNSNIWNTNIYQSSKFSNRNIIKNVNNTSSTPYIINNNKPISKSINNGQAQATSIINSSEVQKTVKKSINSQQKIVDRVVAEQLSLNDKRKQLQKKQLDGPTIQERMISMNNNSEINLKGHGRMSMTRKVDEYSRIINRNNHTQKIHKPTAFGKYMESNIDSATVGKLITGVIKDTKSELASKIAADFSSYKYGKLLSKLF